MSKFKELFTKAQERRIDETGCSLGEATEWIGQQSVGFLIDYTDTWEKVNKEEKPWPQIGDVYYCIEPYSYNGSTLEIRSNGYANDQIDKKLQLLNNFFKTKEDAEFEYKRLEILHELKELSDDDQPWDNKAVHFCIRYDYMNADISICKSYYFRSMNEIYFKSYKSAKNAFETIGKDEIMKYLFGVNK